MNNKRASILAKIRALRAKTVANGCTEAEALAAAAKAAELAAEYDLAAEDVDEVQRAEVWGRGRRTYGTGEKRVRFHETKFVWPKLAKLYRVKCWLEGAELHVFGEREAVADFWYMVDLLIAVSNEGYRDYCRTHMGRARASWMAGFVQRVSYRLGEIIAERDRADAVAAGRSMAAYEIVKYRQHALSARFQQFAALNDLKFVTHRVRTPSAVDGGAYASGARAGDRANLHGSGERLGRGAKRIGN
jgi:hypothetical protein